MLSKLDKGLLLALIFLMGLGLVQVYSSSYVYAGEKFGDALHFFYRQSAFALLGLAVVFATSHIPWKLFEKWGVLIWAAAFIGIILTFVPGLSIEAGGAARWLKMPMGQRFEPSELFKVTWPLFLATILFKDFKFLGQWKWPVFISIILTSFFLLLKQPDFGTVVICSLSLITILFCFGIKWRYIFSGLIVAVPAAVILVLSSPYRYKRIVAFIDPWADPSQKGFQIIQSLLGYYSGGLFGNGLGQGQAKLFFLPEAHTDFTLAVLGEEIGFIGFAAVILVYGFIVFRGVQISFRAKAGFQQMVALGVTVIFAFSVFINAGVTLGMLPTKGLALPFLSYGGSSLVCACFMIGLLLNIEKLKKKPVFKRSRYR